MALISPAMNTYTHLRFEDAQNEMVCLEKLNRTEKEVAKVAGEKKPVTQRNFRVVSVKVSTGPAQRKKGAQKRPCKHLFFARSESIFNQI